MRTMCKSAGEETCFIIADADEKYHEIIQKLVYSPVAEGFAKRFPSNTPDIEKIYTRFAHYAEEMVLQAAGERPIPWDNTVESLLEIVAGKKIDWWIGGSAALALRGLAVTPRDVDLILSGKRGSAFSHPYA
jgi:hypothetical protein